MSIRNLDKAFAPKSIAIIGASDRSGSVGAKLLENVIQAGFEGPIWPVNPKHRNLARRCCYAQIEELPYPPDLAIIATPAKTVPDIIARLGAKGTRAAVVLSAGITEANGLREKMLKAAQPHLLRIIGPNTIGIILPRQKLDASFAHVAPIRGKIALLSQSGAIATTLIDWAKARGIGFSHVISMGDMADVDFGDCIDMLARDPEVKAVMMYLETVTNSRKFMSAARALARIKPIVAIKSGNFSQSAKAAATHTGALAGEDAVFDVALERAGIVRVKTLEDLFAAAQVLTRLPSSHNGRTAIVTNGGGAGVMALDSLLEVGGQTAVLSSETIAALDALLPKAWSHANPVDILGDAPSDRFASAIQIVAADPGVDIVLALSCPTGLASATDSAACIASLAVNGRISGKPLITCWLGDYTGGPARAILEAADVMTFETPSQAIDAIAFLNRRSKVYSDMMRVPGTGSENSNHVGSDLQSILQKAKQERRTMLSEDESKQFLSHFRITIPKAAFAQSINDVAVHAKLMLAEVETLAVKLVAKAVTHKSDVGGVALNLKSVSECVAAARRIKERFQRAYPALVPDGFTVQEMVVIPQAREVLIGTTTDPVFGPAILFGAGGVAAEVIDDSAMALPPLDDNLAIDLIDKTRISRLLEAYRDVPAANRAAIIAALIGISRMVTQFPEIDSMDINPLLVGPDRAVALDARIALIPWEQTIGRADRLSLKPYPTKWESSFQAADQTNFLIRPIRPTDAKLYPAFLEKTTSEDIRHRFNIAIDEWPLDVLVRLTQIDYDREMAFVALDAENSSLGGVSRFASDPDKRQAEYAILIRSDLQGRGLGWALLHHLLEYARAEGIGVLAGDVHADNGQMLKMCREMGFQISPKANEHGTMRVMIALNTKDC